MPAEGSIAQSQLTLASQSILGESGLHSLKTPNFVKMFIQCYFQVKKNIAGVGFKFSFVNPVKNRVVAGDS